MLFPHPSPPSLTLATLVPPALTLTLTSPRPQVEAPVYVANGRFGVQLRGPGGIVVRGVTCMCMADTGLHAEAS
jgi:hypothetical protein